MPTHYEFWDPNDWEVHVFGLVQDRHGVLNVMKVPARHKGDFGIDDFCPSDGVVYQCYAVEEPCQVADRADKQKTKITVDLGKFCSNRPELKALFGSVRIRRWVLAVPVHDSAQVNIHLTAKTEDLRKRGLPYVAGNFEVVVHDLDSFDPVSREQRALRRRSISLPSLRPSQDEIIDWAKAANPLVIALSNKLAKRVETFSAQELEDFVSQAISWFLERENALEMLREKVPELHEEIVAIITSHTTWLQFYGPPPEGTAHTIL